jgi:hypothetical protein
VATPTTTPALSFTITNAIAYTILGNNTTASAAPSYFAPVLASALFANQGTTTQVLHGNTAGNPTWSALNMATDITGVLPLANGGSNANLTANNGGIFYSTATSGAILAGVATANHVLLSGATAAPSWSTATYPATTTVNQLLYSSAASTVTGLATANSSYLTTTAAGVPQWTAQPTQYVASTILGATATTTTAHAAKDIWVTPLYISGTMTANVIEVVVKTALGSAGDVGLYDATGTLVLHAGSGALPQNAGLHAIAISGAPVTMPPGQYYVAITWSSAGGAIEGATTNTAGAVYRTGIITGAGGAALPATITLSSITSGVDLYEVSLHN